MRRNRPPSPQTLQVLAFLASDPTDWRYGLEISRETGLASGSLYPILKRCAERGLLESQWLDPVEPGRPPRHAYRIRPAGINALAEAQERSRGGCAQPFKEKPA